MRYFILIFNLIISITVFADEEALDLNTISEKVELPQPTAVMHKFSLMGRVDISSQTSAPNENADHQLKNNHFLIFLKVKASPITSFMGQIISEDPNQVFYYVEHTPTSKVTVQFGKIIVPFGDTRRFHHIYGGLQDLNSTGVMLPNIWAETGFNVEWQLPMGRLDTYIVNSAVDGNASTPDDPKISQSTDGERQALGLRYTLQTEKQITILFSGYHGSYSPGNGLDLNILGFDLYTNYGAWGANWLKHLRMGAGIAQATFEDRLDEGDINQKGDYIELLTNSVGPGETRVRYGTYIDNDNKESQRDTQSASLGYLMPIDVMRLLVEYQWNFEAINEIDNDLFRAMVSLDF